MTGFVVQGHTVVYWQTIDSNDLNYFRHHLLKFNSGVKI